MEKKKCIATEKAPSSIGPYSQAVEKNGWLFISGQLPVNPETGKLVSGDIGSQTEQVLKNIGAILQAAGYEYEQVVKSTCYLRNIADFAAMNEVYARFYPAACPARVAFGGLDLPMGALVEIETMAVK